MGMAHHGFLSADGKCYSFDHRASGYSRGEGVGSIVVKRLSDAIRDGNTIRAVIRGTGVNQDGRTAGITLPSATAQESLIRSVYKSAGLDLAETRMLESHGTGTAAGDPIEASAAARVFGPHRSKKDPLIVGAIKSGIGHLEGGAGVAGVIKSVLILESGIIPPNVSFEKANPKIPAGRWNLKFPIESQPWPTDGIRRISVNSFGVGGTNGHVILDDAHSYLTSCGMEANHNTQASVPSVEEIRSRVARLKLTEEIQVNGNLLESNGHVTNGNHVNGINGTLANGDHESSHSSNERLFIFNAHDEHGVRRNAEQLADYLAQKKARLTKSDERRYLSDLAFTLSSRRSEFPWRSYCVADSTESLTKKLTADGALSVARVQTRPRLGFVFTGQGAQWCAMGRELMVFSLYRQRINEASEYMTAAGASWKLIDELSLSNKEQSLINSPALSHPACVALQVALVDLLHSWGVIPSAVIGHSSGEIAAAYSAGRLSRQAAWKAAYWRGLVSAKQLAAKGAMLAVGLSSTELYPYLKRVFDGRGELTIACLNSPKNNTVSGDEDKINALKEILDQDGIFVRKLNVKNAYHSAHMREVAEEYRKGMGDLSEGVPERSGLGVRMFSTVTGDEITDKQLGADYWVDNMISSVRFADALVAMGTRRPEDKKLELNSGGANEYAIGAIIELGPHGAMRSAIKETLSSQLGGKAVTYQRVLDRSIPGIEVIFSSLGELYCQGAVIDIEAVNCSLTDEPPRMLIDLPPYKFNHAERVIHESRLSKNFRLRKHPRHDLFGAPVTDWNMDAPRWRQIIRLHELPWLQHHVVTDSYVYPGVGYIIMALEACRQIATPESIIKGFRLVDISIRRALIIPEGKDGVETSLALSKWDEASQWTSSTWNRFVVSSYDPVSDAWVEHCTGYITVEYEAKTNPIDNGREAAFEQAGWQERLQSTFEQCKTPVDIGRIYDNLVTTGLNFGPLFRNLSNVHGSDSCAGEISTTITIPDVASVMPKNYMHEHIIHPSTMDSMFHHFLLSVLDLTGKATLDSAMVPVFVKDVWISAEIPSTPGTQLRGFGKSTLVAYGKYESDITVWHGERNNGLVSIKGLRATPLESMAMSGPQRRQLCHTVEWTAAQEFLAPESFSTVPRSTTEEQDEYRRWVTRLQLAVIWHVTDALQALPVDFNPEALKGHARRYHDWLIYQRERLEADEIIHLSKTQWDEIHEDAEAKKKLYRQVEAYNGDGALAIRMGANIIPFLTGQEDGDPLQVMFRDTLLDQVYDEAAGLGDIPQLFKEYLKYVYQTSSNLRILEIGAGTGASTEVVLSHLSSEGTAESQSQVMSTRIIQYTFTDISAGFFEKAKERFAPWADIMEYKTFNAEQDPASQGIEIGNYDLVVAGNVVHTTSSLKHTLKNMRNLLKPGGKLLMQEGVRQNFLWSPLAFGQLPGWWQGVEPSREWSPWVPMAEWEEHLRSAGFDGITLQFPDRSSADLHTQSLFVATAQGETKNLSSSNIIIVTHDTEPSPLSEALKSTFNCRAVHYLNISKEDLREAVCISLIEFEQPALSTLDEAQYLSIRHLLSTADGLLWLTGDVVERPEFGMIVGMMRSIRWERDIDDANLIPLFIDSSQRSSLKDLISVIGRIFDYQFRQKDPRTVNAEYMLKDGIIFTNRIVEAPVANDFLNSKFLRPTPRMQPLGEAGRPVKLSTAAPGMLDRLEFVTDAVYYEPLDSSLVEIEIKAVGLNFRDVMIAMGEHLAYSLGNEAAGVVTRVGSDVPDLHVGDRVVYMCGFESVGCFHTYGRVQWQNVVKIPDNLSFEDVAGLPCVYSTVIYGLYDIARLAKGETILIHAAAGGIGQAAIQLAKNVGAEVFATVSSPEKRELLMTHYGIPEDHIFSSRDLTFIKGIKRMTQGRGVDVLLNSLSGDALRGSWDIIAPFGRFIEIGKKDSQGGGRIHLEPFLRQAMMASVELPMMMRHKPLLFRRLIADTIKLYSEGKIHQAQPTKVMSYEKIEEALRLLQSGRGMGKIILVPSPADVVPIVPQPRPEYMLDPNATYVLAGGLGGIGRSIGKWMASRGAQHLVFLSRTGKITESVQELINHLRALHCQAHIFACDITNGEAVRKVIEDVSQKLPPIKGCVQGAMVLRVRIKDLYHIKTRLY